jgi:hypothetical protein
MKFIKFLLIISALALNVNSFGMLSDNKEMKCYFCTNTFAATLLDKHGMKSEAFHEWNNNWSNYERGEERFQFAKTLNTRYSLGLDTVIDSIENSVDTKTTTQLAPTSAQATASTDAALPSNANAIYMNEEQKNAAVEKLRTMVETEIQLPQNNGHVSIHWWNIMRPRDGDDSTRWLSFLKRANEKYGFGFNTVIDNIQNGVANPFGDLIATPAATTQPAPTSAQTTAPASAATPSNSNPIGMNAREKSEAIKTLWRLVEFKELWSGNMTRRDAIKDEISHMKLNCIHTHDYQPLLDPIKRMNENFSLGFNKVISNIEQGIPNPFGEPIVPPAIATGGHIVVNLDDIAKLNREMLRNWHWHTPILIDLNLYVPKDSDKQPEATLAVLKIINEKHKCGFDTAIKNIESGVANPFDVTSTSPAPATTQPAPTSTQTTAPASAATPSNSNPIGMNEQQRQLAINTLNQKIWVAVKANKVATMDLSMNAGNYKGEARLLFLKEFNQKYNLGFDDTIQMIEHGVSNPFHTFTDVTITQDGIKNAVAEEPTSTQPIKKLSGGSSYSTRLITEPARARSSMFQHGLPRTGNEPEQQPARPTYTTTRFIRSPLFIGIIGLCLSAGIYHYWQDQKKKLRPEDADADSHEADATAA